MEARKTERVIHRSKRVEAFKTERVLHRSKMVEACKTERVMHRSIGDSPLKMHYMNFICIIPYAQ